MALERILFPITEKCSKLVEWKVKPGSLISKGRILLHYVDVKTGDKPSEVQKLKASKVGTVNSLLIQEGVNIMPGDALLEMESCSHPTVMRDLCAECGADLSNEKQTASVPMVHSVPDLKVSIEQAQKLGKVDEERLLSHKKLVLLVDLDQTLIHTTNDDIPPNLKDVHHFQLYGSTSPWYHTRLRPLTKQFLEDVSQFYELHICTFGARSYAHTIAKILDPDEKLFSHRILSRDECFDSNSKTANLKALFPCGDHMVCIIDDREDVWNFAPNLIAVKPYHFFQHTGDIHAPPGLDKHEQDGSGYTGNEANPAQTVEAEKPKDFKPEATDGPSTAAEDNKDAVEQKSEVKENSLGEIEEASTEVKEKSPAEIEEAPTEVKENSLAEIEEAPTEVKENSLAEIDEAPTEVKEKSPAEIEEAPTEVKENSLAEIEEAPADCAEKVSTDEPCAEPQTADTETKPTENLKSEEVVKEETVNSVKVKEPKCESKEEALIDIPDADDYLLYLQDILQRIHLEYYNLYEETKVAPNMREVVPAVKRRVLAQQSIVFSGVVPTHVQLANSRSAQMARSLGATVTEQIVPGETTHLVAARPGTAKVNEARRAGTGIHIVSPEWLVCTSERWERAEERLFPLTRSAKRIIPESNSRLSTSSMAESLNPLLALSSEDLKSMDQEVEDIFNETDDESAMDRDADSEEDDEEDEERKEKIKFDNSEICAELLTELKSESCLEVDDAAEEMPSKKRSISAVDEGDSASEGPNTKLFRDYSETPTSDADEDLGDSGDESELCEMGLALEREFLAD